MKFRCVLEIFKRYQFYSQICSEDDTVCLPLFQFCDGKADCPFGSDELNCPCETLKLIECGTTQQNGIPCMPMSWVCAGGSNCVKSDSSICDMTNVEPPCTENEFQCHLEETLEKQCISSIKVCDNETDCIGGEDLLFRYQLCISVFVYVDKCYCLSDQEYK